MSQFITKKKKRYDKIVLLVKPKLNSIEILIYRNLIGSYIIQYDFVLLNNAQKKIKWYERGNQKLKTSSFN